MLIKQISYAPLWEILIERELPKSYLCRAEFDTRITSRSLYRLVHNQSVNTDILLRVCSTLGVNLSDICVTQDIGSLACNSDDDSQVNDSLSVCADSIGDESDEKL